MKNTDNLPIMAFETQQDWEAWLEEHHTNTKGIWLKLAKKDTGIASVFYAEALEGCAGYFLRKSPEKKTNARKVHFHPLLCLAEAFRLGYPF